MSLIDTHTHLDGFGRDGVLPAVLARAREAGLEAMIAVGTAPDDWGLYRDMAGEHGGFVRYTVGLHPCSVDAGWEGAVAQMEGFWRGSGPRSSSVGQRACSRPPEREQARCPTKDGSEREQARCPTREESGGVAAGNPAPIESIDPNSSTAPVAIGECGLDRFHLPKETEAAERILGWQKAAFEVQLGLAKRLGCALVVHSRGAFAECVAMIDASGVDWTKVVFHCFSEGPGEISELVQRGGRGSFTGILTYKNAENVRQAARVQGLGRLMVETDAPFLAPVPHRGSPNEPAYVRHTAEYAAAMLGVPFEELAEVTTKNAKVFFGI